MGKGGGGTGASLSGSPGGAGGMSALQGRGGIRKRYVGAAHGLSDVRPRMEHESMTTTIGACGRCGGAMIEGHDIYGRYSSCVTCGHLDDQDAKPMNVQTLEELGEGQHSDSERTTATVDITIIQYPLIHSAVPRFTPVKFRAVYRVPTLAMQKRGIRYELLGLTRTKYPPYP